MAETSIKSLDTRARQAVQLLDTKSATAERFRLVVVAG